MSNDGDFGLRSNAFGFNVTGYSNQIVAIESCADLAADSWSSLQTNILADAPLYFADPDWTKYPHRYYRIRAQ